MTIYRLTIPARVNILGNPSDANEGDFATLSAAVDRYAHAWIGPLEEKGMTPDASAIERPVRTLDLRAEDIPLPYTDDLDLIKGAVNRLHAYSTEFRAKIAQRGAHNDYVLAELTQRVEAKELGITCGYADRYAPLFGGLAYVDYCGKLHQKDLGQEPYATYERLDP